MEMLPSVVPGGLFSRSLLQWAPVSKNRVKPEYIKLCPSQPHSGQILVPGTNSLRETLNPKHQIPNNIKAQNTNVQNSLDFGIYLELGFCHLDFGIWIYLESVASSQESGVSSQQSVVSSQ